MQNVLDFFAANPDAQECYLILGYVKATLEEADALAAGTNQKPELFMRPLLEADAPPPAPPPVEEPVVAVEETVVAPETEQPAEETVVAPETVQPAEETVVTLKVEEAFEEKILDKPAKKEKK